jgi:dihydrofolate synthase/folylpolyglutamate synthase
MLTAMAVAYLAPRTDRLVCEVGLGGRLDATNALDLGVAVVTNVDLDHQKYLGDTIEEIAREKAAIIKQGNQVITGSQGAALRIVEERARQSSARLWRLGDEVQVEAIPRGWDGFTIRVTGPGFERADLELPLLGDYQPSNAALAVAAAHVLDGVDDGAVRKGLASTRWPGRLQVIANGPRVILDGGHNPAALTKAGTALRLLIGSERLVVVFGMLRERDPQELFKALRTMSPDAVVFTDPASAAGHAHDPRMLASVYGAGSEALQPASSALDRARELADRNGNVLVCGSLYLVGEILAQSQTTRL